MNKVFNVILFWLLTSHTVVVAQDSNWHKVQLGDSVTVEFPGLPTKKETEDKVGQAHAYVFNDGKALYMTMVQENALEPESSAAEVEQFYNGALRGGGMHVIDSKKFNINGFTGVESQFTTPSNPRLPAVKFMRVIAVNGTAYIQSFWTSAEQEKKVAADRQHFFSSLQVKVDKVHQAADEIETNSFSYRIGKLFGKLAFYGLLLFIFFKIIQRRRQSKNKNQS